MGEDAEINDAIAEAFAAQYGLSRLSVPSAPFESGFHAGMAYVMKSLMRSRRTRKPKDPNP